MAGFWHLSHHQMRDPNGEVYAGAKANFYEADGLTRIPVYQDYGLGTAHANPVEANAYGVFPPVFFDEDNEFYRQRITTAGGVLIPGTDVGTLPIIGPTGGGGGSEVPVDENALFKTGDVLWLDVTGTRAGWVRDNGRTIGSSVSGGTERANADCEALFLFLYAAYSDTICPVTGGRGASAAADWAANKPIQLPDKRGYIPGGLDDMGNSAANRLTGVPVGSGTVTSAGSKVGGATHTLLTAEIPAHSHGVTDPGHTHAPLTGGNFHKDANGTNVVNATINNATQTGDPTTASATTGITINNAGGGGVHNNTQLTVLGTFYRKL